jgi:uncharacterized membrane protein
MLGPLKREVIKMMTDRFSIKEALKFGWETAKGNLLFFFVAFLITILVNILSSLVGFVLGIDDSKPAPLAITIISFIITLACIGLSFVVQLGFVRIALRFCSGEKGRYSDLFSTYPLAVKYIIASLLYGLIILGGMILLIVPGVIWGIRFSYYSFFIVDKRAGIMESLKESYRITKDLRMKIFLFLLVLMGINLLGAVPLGIGLLVTIPLSMVAYASVFRRLAGKPDDGRVLVPTERPAKAPLKVAFRPRTTAEAERRPSSPGAEWRSRGLCCLQRNDFIGAAEAFTKAVEMDSRYGPAYHSRGFAYYHAGEYLQAKSDFDRAIELDGNYAKEAGAFMYRGLTMEKLGDRRQAIEDMKLAVSFGNRGANNWLAQMNEGKEPQ